MYQVSEAQTALIGLIGWRQPTKTGLPTLDTTAKATSSGMYYQDFSSLVTIENLYYTQNDEAISDANFNTYLANIEKAAINKVLRAIFEREDIVENRVLYPGEYELTETDRKSVV